MDKRMTGFRLNVKIKSCMLAAVAALFLSGCRESIDENITVITLQKDGTILSQISESFAQDYYDDEDLKQTILAEAADYNKAAGTGKINVEKISVEDGLAAVRMLYQEAADYAGFNQAVFFAGSTESAGEEYELNIVLSGTRDSNDTVGRSDILAMKDYKLLITDVQELVILDGRAEYISDNITVSDNRKNIQLTGDGMGYVLYK
ncbi:MAG: hypothetical protein NC429_03545 [Lachnospiraceae bacterium]|nr:hypothetical protein [Lachnospiraceae bacterium]